MSKHVGWWKYFNWRYLNMVVSLNVPWTVHHDINFEAITNLMHRYLYSYNIIILYMFWALLCSSSGGQIVYVQHLVPSLSVSGLALHLLRENSDAVYIQFDLLKMSISLSIRWAFKGSEFLSCHCLQARCWLYFCMHMPVKANLCVLLLLTYLLYGAESSLSLRVT